MASLRRNGEMDLLHGGIFKTLMAFSFPFLISNIFQQLYNTADTMIVGHLMGSKSLAAIGAASVIYQLLVGFALGVGSGMSIVVARAYGSGDEERVKRAVSGSLVLGAMLSIVVALGSDVLLKPLLEILQTPPEIFQEAYDYISTIILYVGVMFAYNLLAGILRASGNSVAPLAFLILSSLLNIGLDILFILSFHWGVRGAAVATVASQGISAVLCVIYIMRKCPRLIPAARHFVPERALYGELLSQGFSMGLMLSIVSLGTVILQASINSLGYLTVAGHTAARKLNGLCLMPVSALSLSVSTFVSQNKGAGMGWRVVRAVRCANRVLLAWGAFATVALFFAAPAMVRFLSGSDDPVLMQNGALYLRLNAPFYAILGSVLIIRSTLQGLGQKLLPLVSSVIELLGKLLFVWLVIPITGYLGIILCEPIIWCLMLIQLAYSYRRNPYVKSHSAVQRSVAV